MLGNPDLKESCESLADEACAIEAWDVFNWVEL